MFELMLIATAVIAIAGIVLAYDGSHDAFHPLVFIGPMFLFPLRLDAVEAAAAQRPGGVLR